MGKDAALAEINTIPEETVPAYPFVVDPATGMTEAQGVDPDLLGATTDWDVIASTLPVADILEEPDTESGAWARYALTNPVTGKMEKSAAGLFCVRGSSSGRDITPTCPPGGGRTQDTSWGADIRTQCHGRHFGTVRIWLALDKLAWIWDQLML